MVIEVSCVGCCCLLSGCQPIAGGSWTELQVRGRFTPQSQSFTRNRLNKCWVRKCRVNLDKLFDILSFEEVYIEEFRPASLVSDQRRYTQPCHQPFTPSPSLIAFLAQQLLRLKHTPLDHLHESRSRVRKAPILAHLESIRPRNILHILKLKHT